jgi:outer membrane receptor protein involved in Fe transport
MMHPLQRASWLLAGALMCTVALADLQGRRVSDVLDELRAQGLTFIYNTQIVPPDLLIARQPRARKGVELAREILAAHGLALSQAAPGVYAVISHPPPVDARVADGADGQSTEPTLEEIVVQTSRYTLASDSLATQTFLTQEQVKNMPRLADETLRAIQRLPGSATNGFSSLGAVRGGDPNETSIVLDGLRLYEPFHLKNFLSPVSLLDSRLIDGIEFYSGGFPAIYGDRLSAIIDATTVRPAQPRYYEIGLNLFHLSGLASGQFADGRGHALISARRSNIGDLAHFSENDFGEPHYSDGFGRIDYRLDDRTLAAVDLLMSSDAIDAQKSSGTQEARAQYRNVYLWGTLQHDWSQRASSRLILSYTDLDNERHGEVNEPGGRLGSVSDERLFHVIGLRIENKLQTDAIHHRFGAEVRRLWGEYDYSMALRLEPGFPFPGSPGSEMMRTAAPEPDGYESSAYWDGRADFGKRWSVQAGMRVDTQTYDGTDDGEQWSPRLSVLYQLAPNTHLRASWGRFYQSQGINELQVEDGIDRFHPAQHADHAILSLDHSFAAGFDLRVEAYRKDYRQINPRFENLFDPLVLFPEAEFDRVMIDPQSARAEGVETLLRMQARGPWSGWFSYVWSRSQDRIEGRDIARSWDQRHAINLGVVWAKGPWTAAVTNSFHTGWPTTMLEVTTAPGGAPQIVIARRNRTRFAAFDILDFRVTRTFALSRGVLDVFVEANNTLSRENACCASYRVTQNPDGSLSYVRDVDSWLPLVPSAGVLWRY